MGLKSWLTSKAFDVWENRIATETGAIGFVSGLALVVGVQIPEEYQLYFGKVLAGSMSLYLLWKREQKAEADAAKAAADEQARKAGL